MKGFEFNIDRCVACHACLAGCYLENNGAVSWRRVLNEGSKSYPGLPVHNISIACNHCEDAPCMEGCPANAYKRDTETGAVVLMEKNCIGCNYCFWNCPYDAPQYNPDSRIIEKCTLCADRVKDGYNPACVSACPTGALMYNEIKEENSSGAILSDTGIGAKLIINGSIKQTSSPRIVPEEIESTGTTIENISKVKAGREWSLILFSFISSLLFSLNVSYSFGTMTYAKPVYIVLMALVLLLPLVHLGKPGRAWRSISGVFRSALSTEIFFLLLFAASSLASLVLDLRIFWIVSFISGIIFLISIDGVYTYSDKKLKTHSGQAFLIGLILSSFFLGEILPFVFVALIKISAMFYNYLVIKPGRNILTPVIYSIIQMLIVLALLFDYLLLPAFILLLSAELLNRILYYIDFNPTSVISEFYSINLSKYEQRKSQQLQDSDL